MLCGDQCHCCRMSANVKLHIMKKIRFGTNFAVFVLFFGLATLEAITSGSWTLVAFWIVIGSLFLVGDNIRSRS